MFKENAYPTVSVIIFKCIDTLKCEKKKDGQTKASNEETGHLGIDLCRKHRGKMGMVHRHDMSYIRFKSHFKKYLYIALLTPPLTREIR